MKIKITPWSTASFLILAAAIVFAAIARGHSVEMSKTMAKAIQAKAESGSDAPVNATRPEVERHMHADRVFGGIGFGLAGLGFVTWLVSVAREKREASLFPALLLAIYVMLSMMLT